MLLRSVHTTIVNEMGWPSWISYVIFAVSTIVMGALLGLVSAQNIHFAITVFTREATFHHESKKKYDKILHDFLAVWCCKLEIWITFCGGIEFGQWGTRSANSKQVPRKYCWQTVQGHTA